MRKRRISLLLAEDGYVIQKTFWGRVNDILQSLIGNGYDLVAKPHTATWLVLFMAVTMYLTCFVAKPGSPHCWFLIDSHGRG